MKPFQKLFEHHASRDVRKCLDPPLDMDWKSAPNVKWLVKQRTFFRDILDVAPNTVVTSRKLKDAVQRLHEEEPLITNKKDETTLWDYLDTKVRIGLAQLRELKHNRDFCLDRGLRKLSEAEQRELNSLLEKVHFNKDEVNGGAQTDSQPEEPSPPPSSSPLALVAASSAQEVTPATTKSLLRTPTKTKKSTEEIASVFEAILQKKKQTSKQNLQHASSDPSTPESIMFARKKLTFDDDDDDDDNLEEESEVDGTKIKILPKGKSIIEQKKVKKGKIREEVAAKESRKIDKKKRCEVPASSSGKHGGRAFMDVLLDEYTAEDGGENEDVDENITDHKGAQEEQEAGGSTPPAGLSPVSRLLLFIAYAVVCGMFESGCCREISDQQ